MAVAVSTSFACKQKQQKFSNFELDERFILITFYNG